MSDKSEEESQDPTGQVASQEVEVDTSDDNKQSDKQTKKEFEEALKEPEYDDSQPIPNLMEHMRKIQRMKKELNEMYE